MDHVIRMTADAEPYSPHSRRQNLGRFLADCGVFNFHSNCLFIILASGYINCHAYASIGKSKDGRNVSNTATDSGRPTKTSSPLHNALGQQLVIRSLLQDKLDNEPRSANYAP